MRARPRGVRAESRIDVPCRVCVYEVAHAHLAGLTGAAPQATGGSSKGKEKAPQVAPKAGGSAAAQKKPREKEICVICQVGNLRHLPLACEMKTANLLGLAVAVQVFMEDFDLLVWVCVCPFRRAMPS